jgi:hypothetical protein
MNDGNTNESIISEMSWGGERQAGIVKQNSVDLIADHLLFKRSEVYKQTIDQYLLPEYRPLL